MKEIFIKFLKDNNAYDAFVKNLLIHGFTTIDNLITTTNPDLWISSAFFWTETAEEHDYWYSIDQAWKIILNKED